MIRSRWALAILGVCLAARVGFFLAVQPWRADVRDEVILQSDAAGYHQLAETLRDTGRFALGPAGEPNALRTPLYPLLLAGVYGLGGSPWVVLLIHAAIATGGCALLMVLVGRFAGVPAGLVTGVLYALDPLMILYGTMLLSDVLFVFLCVVVLALLALTLTAGAARRAAATAAGLGAVIGLAALTRPVGAWLPAVMLVAMIVTFRKRPARLAGLSAVMLLAFAAVISPWVVRNARTYNTVGLSTSGDYNLLVLHVGAMEAARRDEPYEQVKAELLARSELRAGEEGRGVWAMSPFERAEFHRRTAIAIILRHPGSYASSSAAGAVRTLGNFATADFSRMLRWGGERFDFRPAGGPGSMLGRWARVKSGAEIAIGVGVAIYLLACYSLTAAGLIVAWGRTHRGLLLACLLAALYFVLAAGPGGLGRFRLPAAPFYLTFAGIGGAWLLARRER